MTDLGLTHLPASAYFTIDTVIALGHAATYNPKTAWRFLIHQAVLGLYNRGRRLTLRKPLARL